MLALWVLQTLSTATWENEKSISMKFRLLPQLQACYMLRCWGILPNACCVSWQGYSELSMHLAYSQTRLATSVCEDGAAVFKKACECYWCYWLLVYVAGHQAWGCQVAHLQLVFRITDTQPSKTEGWYSMRLPLIEMMIVLCLTKHI